MTRIIVSPSKYIQGVGELKQLASYYQEIAKKQALILVDPFVLEVYDKQIAEGFEKKGIGYKIQAFGGECSQKEIGKILEDVSQEEFGAVIAIGGGKTIDTGKAIADSLSLQVIVVPTIAATDASTSRHSVIYSNSGVFESVRYYSRNPSLVLVDTQIIANAPVRFLISGIGDALATYIEARASFKSNSKAMAGGLSTRAAQALAKLSYEILLENSYQAKLACQSNTVSRALEDVIEANIYLSGIGFESGGLGAAHALHGGFTSLPETLSYYHGERVAFGILVQLVLENAPQEEIEQVLDFLYKIGLPVCFEDIGITNPTPEKIWQVAQIACEDGETIYSLPFQVTTQLTYSALLVADQLGKAKKAQEQLFSGINPTLIG